MSKFNVGDKVRRITRFFDFNIATSGKVVTVSGIDGYGCIAIEEDEYGCDWDQSCYELVEPAQEPKSSDVVFITTAEYEGLRNRIAELEEILKDKKDEWIPYNGEGYCPVDPETKIDVKFKGGYINRNQFAGVWTWNKYVINDHKIIAYRIAK